jgi:cytoskeletal protein CcmA (bactofilin family)
MVARANSIAGVTVLLVVVAGIGVAVGLGANYFKAAKPTPTPKVETLSADELKKLGDLSTSLGNSNQVLNIGTNTIFRGKIDVGSDLTVGGRFNANGPVTLSQLNITGTTALTGLSVGSNLTVAGSTTLQKGLTVAGGTAINGSLNVSGTATANALNATSITVNTITISGPLTIAHLRTQGAVPNVAAGSVGGGGTVSLSGNDTAGTININTGSGPAAGVLATVTFKAAYSGGVHVIISPLTGASASLPAYVTRTSTGFQVRADGGVGAGTAYAFDYIVTQ